MPIVIVEYTVQVIARSEAETEALMLRQLRDTTAVTWQRSATPVRVLTPKEIP